MYKILIVEGDVNFSSTLKIYLEQDNSEVVIVNNFEKLMGYLYPFHPYIVILGAEDDCLIPPFIYGVIVAKIKRYLCREYDEFVLNPPERFIKVEELIFYPERLEIHLKKGELL
ncbi:response regulator transcription factor [Bacillus sp. TH13]|uniref:response regulator transcription factor n=1 Tax=Bacillus sp. TH13 TaxID=2796379 RepID=UPI0019121548|nr:response regulator transcription factor [Bacillus sp. TH13]MBK5493233.1 response regulator transcription factor [Bacillus sp. TH13]